MIRNVVFDVGNVFVRWSPPEVIQRSFGLAIGTDDNRTRGEALFRSQVWRRLNLGQMSQAEAELAYQADFGLRAEQARQFFFHVMDHQEVIDGTVALAHRLKLSGYRVLA